MTRTNGVITRYRARYVAKGFTQIPGVDFFNTFAPVAKIESIRILMALAAILDWEFQVIDVDSAFLNSGMPKDQLIYVRQPPGYQRVGKEHWVWLLLKGLYGLRQSAYLWYQKLKAIMIRMGFYVCRSDPCVFIRSSPSATSIVAAHVDDLGLYCSSIAEVELLKSQFREHVNIKDGGDAKMILGMEIIRDSKARTISLSHRFYIDTIVKRFRQEDARPVYSPMNTSGPPLSKADCPKTQDERQAMLYS